MGMTLNMTPLPEVPPLPIVTSKPVRLVLVGGFLGAGKTTALTALAKALTERGLRVGVVTNDQAAHLVDTATVRQAGFTTAEVAGGCFCCRFTDLADAAQRVISAIQPDVLLCEPVGSCTDMAATVIAPLRHFYPAEFQIAPFSVLVDPRRVRELALGEAVPLALAAEAAYIFSLQLQEADEIVLNKVDRLTDQEAEHLATALHEKFGKPVRLLSAMLGDGIEDWADYLLGSATDCQILPEVDYDTYAAGEAVLGWLNATVSVTAVGKGSFNPRTLAQEILGSFIAINGESIGEVTHAKLALSDGPHFLRANLTSSSGALEFSAETDWQEATQATLVFNARVQSNPERLERLVRELIQQVAARAGAVARIETLECFSPSYPRPPYRVPVSAAA